ncbi:MAG: flagellar M-ring protein FliF [Thalassobium sp.]|uniref:Flagellar M-ring protein n=2 Tax=Thalassolituus pacificus TaxID=2975440 RepID=A0A9X2WBD6_9GAMM|nr:flagellar basal-body MS-ring/collar protein FliF [Thalassolituus pacificus]MCT7357472.1 flagellar basal-body MS-ring/collar protein FliF [Thalassolituus pacificus]PHS63273.1 MAG: flagellar M-ring protein FliF [Thalassobium sp.]
MEISAPAKQEPEDSGHPVLSGFNRLSIVRQIGVIAGIALVIALAIAILMWSREPTYKPLIHRLQDHNAQEIIEVLQRESIPFEIDPTTQILLVQAGDLHEARMKLAAASLIDDKTVGLEVLDKDSTLGTSQFIENARYRRGLEGELARTIASVKSVRNARVHLALPKQSVFVRDQRKPRASVFVELYAGRDLSRDQVEAIVNLVASSVSEMDHADVSVVDQKGNLLSKIEEQSGEMLAHKQLEYTEKVQSSITQAVNNILKPVLGTDNYKAEVSADVDFTVQEQSEELYNPDLIALRSEQLLNEENADKTNGGIPGALSNQPPAAANAPEVANGGGGAGGAGVNRRSESTRNYEIDRTLSYKQQQVGRIRRLTVAVVVNDRASLNADGDTVYSPWTDNDLQRLEILVKDAVGFNAARGDSVNVINSPFMGKGEIELGDPDFWTQPWFWEIMKQILAGLFILVLIFGVIRPTIKSIANRGRDEASILLDELEDAEAGLDDDKVTLAGMDEFLLPGASESFERQLDALKGLIAEDPARVAQVVIKWVNEDHGK